MKLLMIKLQNLKGYDIDVQSFNQQFPDYYNDIYVFNKNLEINGAYQNLAHINEENKITFNINLSQEEKSKIEEIRDKKQVLSKLIDKDIKEKENTILILKMKNTYYCQRK